MLHNSEPGLAPCHPPAMGPLTLRKHLMTTLKTMDRLLARFQPDLHIAISWHHEGTLEHIDFRHGRRPPAVFHCTRPGCLGTGFSLIAQIQAALAAAHDSEKAFLEYTDIVECMGTILDGTHARPCERKFTVRISASLIPPEPPRTL